MTVGDILVSINQASLETMLPLTAVQTSADIERYYKEGYSIGITATEFAKKYPRLPHRQDLCCAQYACSSLLLRAR